MNTQREVVIVSGVRTAVGDFGGGLKDVATEDPRVRRAMIEAYERLHRLGVTHSVEAWRDGELRSRLFRRADVEPKGQAQQFTRAADSGFAVTFHFCPNCGSSVYWEPSRIPEAIAVAVGCFADPAFPQPSQAVYTQHRHVWAKFSD